MSFMLVWLRLSTMKQLDWYRNSSYQSKDIAHVQKTITQRFADKVSTCIGQVPATAVDCLQTCCLAACCHATSCSYVPHSMPGIGRCTTAANSRPPHR